MQQQQPTQIGEFVAGGFFGGVINVNGTHKGVIWAPKKEGQIKAILLPQGRRYFSAQSPNDCLRNTQELLTVGSPAAQQVTALNINGFSDWLIPSRDVLELGYRHFKPTTNKNYCSWRDGENPNSVPPGWLYTPEFPAQTPLAIVLEVGQEAFDDYAYWSSTVLPNGETAFYQYFYDGCQIDSYLCAECRVRAVRLIQLGS